MDRKMIQLQGIESTRRWVYVAAIFLLKLRMCLAGDPCPPEKELDPCICYINSEMRVRLQTTPVPEIITPARPILEESLSKKRRSSVNEMVASSPQMKDGSTPRSTEDSSLLNFPLTPLNATCCTVVSCNAPKSLLILENAIVNALNRKWVDKLVVANLPPEKGDTLVRLPRRWLKLLRVKHFEIRDTLLPGDFIHYGNPFEGQEQSMLWFSARNCHLSGSMTYETLGTVNTKGLFFMPKIEGVDFSHNHLLYISGTAFNGPPANLSTVILSFNSIQGIGESAFRHIAFLKRLDVSHNLLETISRNMFTSPARNLQVIDLSWNRLTTLPRNFFDGMPRLKEVILANNFLTSLPDYPWSPIWRQLRFIDILHNFILCDCSLSWLLSILSPPVAKAATTPAPRPLSGQLVLGSCTYVQPNSVNTVYSLTNLTRSSLNCP